MKKIIKSFIYIATLTALTTNVFANTSPRGKKGPDFQNTLGTDIVDVDTTSGNTTFGGVSNNTKVELLSGQIDAGLDVTFGLYTRYNWDGTGYKNTYAYLSGDSSRSFNMNDWYIEYRPIPKFTMGLHDAIYAHGATLPVNGGNIKAGDMGSDFVGVLRPIDGLRIGFGFDFLSWFGRGEHDTRDYPYLNVGADYTYGKIFSIGLAVRNPINQNKISVGAYGEFTGVDNLKILGGFSYNDEQGIGSIAGATLKGKVLISAGATYTYKKFDFAADFATVIAETKAYDMYLGAKAQFNATKDFNIGATFKTLLDFGTNSDSDRHLANRFFINAALSYTYKNNIFGAGFSTTIYDNHTHLTFPISWTVKL